MNPNKSDGNSILKRKGEYASLVPRKIPINSSQVASIKRERNQKPKISNPNCNSAPNKYRKLHNCLPAELTPIFNKNKAFISKRKSISLVELPSIQKMCILKKRYSKEHGDEAKIPIVSTKCNIVASLTSVQEFELARKVCKMFILHSWRKRRHEVTKLQINTQKLENEVQNLNIQIIVLRNLLESEKVRVAVALSDSAHLKQLLENELKTTDQLRADLKHMETERYLQENLISQKESEIRSLKKELSSLNSINQDLREEIESHEIDLNEAREKEAHLLSKLDAKEIRLKDQINSLKTMTEKSTALQTQIEQLISGNRTLCEEKEMKAKEMEKCLNKIRKLDVELNNIKNIRTVQNEDIDNLTKEMSIAKDKIKEQEKIIRGLISTINQYKFEKEEFERRFVKIRNGAVFEAIQICSKLFLPMQI